MPCCPALSPDLWTSGCDKALATTPGFTINLDFNQACQKAGVTFIPLLVEPLPLSVIVETLDGWHTAAVDQTGKLARAGVMNQGKEEEDEAVKQSKSFLDFPWRGDKLL